MHSKKEAEPKLTAKALPDMELLPWTITIRVPDCPKRLFVRLYLLWRSVGLPLLAVGSFLNSARPRYVVANLRGNTAYLLDVRAVNKVGAGDAGEFEQLAKMYCRCHTKKYQYERCISRVSNTPCICVYIYV